MQGRIDIIISKLRKFLPHPFLNLFFVFVLLLILNRLAEVETNLGEISEDYSTTTQQTQQLQENYTEALFQEHIAVMEQRRLSLAKEQIEKEYEELKSGATSELLEQVESVYTQYQDAASKIDRNKALGLSTVSAEEAVFQWGTLFLGQEFDQLTQNISQTVQDLEQDYSTYLASLPTPTPLPPAPPSVSAQGYSYQTVSIDRGTFGVYVLKLPLSSVRVKTVAANGSDCTDNCPTKTLAEYVNENGGYAGIHGTYFCPPDYSSCAGKTNSYDFALFDSNANSWRNEHTLQWYNNGLAAFNNTTPIFYEDIQQYYFDYGNGGVTAGISNFPMLLIDSDVVVNESELTSYQRDVKGARGAIGVGETNIYLAVITNATVVDTAYVLQSLGIKHALNLDGGGSSALYVNGSYKVGPGRSLPNAIVLVTD